MGISQELYDKMVLDNKATDMIRYKWDRLWKPDPDDVTVVICQGKQRFNTQLCLESMLRFYPDIRIVVVNGSPDDFDSTYYLRYMAVKHPNVNILEHSGLNAHGLMMDKAIKDKVITKYVLLMDNDTIVKRGGWVEGMMDQMDQGVFATGTLMVVSRKNEACGVPHDESDVLRYAHPSCAIIDKEIYLKLKPFVNHGAPCCHTMIDAEKKGYKVESFPIDQYVLHLSGASWCKPVTIWINDHEVLTRPFISFVIVKPSQLFDLENQDDHDFEIHTLGSPRQDQVIYHDGTPSTNVRNRLYDLRFRLRGEYIILLPENVETIGKGYVRDVRANMVNNYLPDEINVGGLMVVKRRVFQYRECLTSTL